MWSIPLPRLRLEAGAPGSAGPGREAPALRTRADGAGRLLPHGRVPPTPRIPEGFYLAIALADQVGANFIIGTDPDSDRVGIMVRGTRRLASSPCTGNQTGVLLAGLSHRRHARVPARLPENARGPEDHRHHRDGPQGGREPTASPATTPSPASSSWPRRRTQLESQGQGKVIFSYEESYGYMLGDYVRDKDAVTASLLLTEMAAWYQPPRA
ncbi:MAG: hypothetical protein ACLUNQ_08920 [Oscillospiraceae bacterium]